jgi:transketolase
LKRGAYVLADLGQGEPQMILMSSGSEVGLIVEVGRRLAENGTPVRLVSFPSWELFEEQDESYQREVLPPNITKRLAVEAAIPQGWHQWLGSQGKMLGLNRFGASAPGKVALENLGFTVENVERAARELLENS